MTTGNETNAGQTWGAPIHIWVSSHLPCERRDRILFRTARRNYYPAAWEFATAREPKHYNLPFRKFLRLSKGKIVIFRLTRNSEFPRCWVIVSLGCSEKNTVSPVIREVTATHSLLIGAPRVCPAFVSFPVVIAYVSVHSSLVIEMRVYFVSSGLKNTGWAPRV